MNVIPSDHRERALFVERSIDAALKGLQDPVVAKNMGSLAVELSDQLDNFDVANCDGTEISLDGIAQGSKLVVFVIKKGDKLRLSADFNVASPAQRANYHRHLAKWQPKYDDIVDVLELDSRLHGPGPDIEYTEYTASMTGMLAEIVTVARRERQFENPPQGVVLFRKQPVLLFITDDISSFHQPFVTVHELTHYNQNEANPVTHYTSSNNVTMQSLRDELEAYGACAPLIYRELAAMTKEEVEKADGVFLLGAIVDSTRRKNLMDATDPYKPSGYLLKKLEEAGASTILHMAVDYAALAEVSGIEQS